MTSGVRTKEYLDYIKSKAWSDKRAKKLRECPTCEEAHDIRYRLLENGDAEPVKMCSGRLEVHHRTYARLGREEMYDLGVLCEYHHARVHESWASRKRYYQNMYIERDY